MRLIQLAVIVAGLIGHAFAQSPDQRAWTDPKGFDPAVLDKVDKHFRGLVDQDFIDKAAPHQNISQCGGDFDAPMQTSPDWQEAKDEYRAEELSSKQPPEIRVALAPEFDPVSLELRLESYCEARFNITPSGETEDIKVRCTLRPFVASTRKAVGAMKFVAAEQDGPLVSRRGITLPVAYCHPDPQPGV